MIFSPLFLKLSIMSLINNDNDFFFVNLFKTYIYIAQIKYLNFKNTE